jgi:hypothetical protein
VDVFVYMIRDWPLVVRAMGRTRLTSRAFGPTLGLPAGERRGLAPGGTLRGFQFLLQPLDFLSQPPPLFVQPLVLLLQLLIPPVGMVAFLPSTAQLLRQFPDAKQRINGLEKQIIL